MGFNNPGSKEAASRLARHQIVPIPVGANIGKSKITDPDDLEAVITDYVTTFLRLRSLVDFITVNISSPNTPGLRDLARRMLRDILMQMQDKNRKFARMYGVRPVPLGYKLSPDDSDEVILDIVDTCVDSGMAFLVATNTTTCRDKTAGWSIPAPGGVSGAPLTERSREVLQLVYRRLQDMRVKIPIISVGGIMDGDEAYERILLGADLVQAYTGWVYGGPTWPREVLKTIVRCLKRDGFENVSDAVGSGVN